MLDSENAIAIMTDAIELKFEQNPELKEYLSNTVGRLVEASTDKFWGSGININNKNAASRKNGTETTILVESLTEKGKNTLVLNINLSDNQTHY